MPTGPKVPPPWDSVEPVEPNPATPLDLDAIEVELSEIEAALTSLDGSDDTPAPTDAEPDAAS